MMIASNKNLRLRLQEILLRTLRDSTNSRDRIAETICSNHHSTIMAFPEVKTVKVQRLEKRVILESYHMMSHRTYPQRYSKE